ncbi:MAG TPA: HEAT repeat domain-containing protein [Gemmatimonadales bacterium]|jgi:hypothetical protein
MRTFLLVVAVLQFGFLVATFALLVVRRQVDRANARRRNAEHARLTQIVLAALGGGPLEPALDHIDQSHFDAVAAVLYRHARPTGDPAWERLVRGARTTRWFGTLRDRYVHSRFWWRRLVGARSLSIVATADDLDIARALVADKHPAVKLAAIAILDRAHDPGLIELVLNEAIASKRVVRGYMFDTLTGLGRALTPILSARLTHPRSTFELRDLIRLAASTTDPELLDEVLALKDHADPEVRGGVARTLGSYPGPATRDALLTLIGDDAWQVRTRAAIALGAVGGAHAADPLSKALSDNNWWVRLRAAIALRRLGDVGDAHLARARDGDDRFAAEMASYAMGLTEAAVQDYLA